MKSVLVVEDEQLIRRGLILVGTGSFILALVGRGRV